MQLITGVMIFLIQYNDYLIFPEINQVSMRLFPSQSYVVKINFFPYLYY